MTLNQARVMTLRKKCLSGVGRLTPLPVHFRRVPPQFPRRHANQPDDDPFDGCAVRWRSAATGIPSAGRQCFGSRRSTGSSTPALTVLEPQSVLFPTAGAAPPTTLECHRSDVTRELATARLTRQRTGGLFWSHCVRDFHACIPGNCDGNGGPTKQTVDGLK